MVGNSPLAYPDISDYSFKKTQISKPKVGFRSDTRTLHVTLEPSRSGRRPPWEAIGQLNEANLVWNDDLSARLLKVAARFTGILCWFVRQIIMQYLQ